MAERTGGETRPSGSVSARKVMADERAPRSSAVRYERTQVSARLTEDGLSVTVQGMASFGGRTVAKAVDVDPASGALTTLEKALRDVAEEYGDAAADAALEAAYEVRALAVRSGEDVEGQPDAD